MENKTTYLQHLQILSYPSSVVFLFALIFNMTSASAQMRYWTMPEWKYDMQNATITRTSLGGGNFTTGYNHANGAYDEFGNLLFCVKSYGDIINANGTLAGTLGNWSVLSQSVYMIQGVEFGIVPVPGTCRKFYVIYTRSNPIGNLELLYAIVDATNPNACTVTQTVYPNQGNQVEGLPIGHFQGHLAGFAISKVVSGAGPTAKRLLFCSTGFQLKCYDITATGIGNEITVASTSTTGFANIDFTTHEIEINQAGDRLAWGNDNKVYRINVSPTTGSFVAGSLSTVTMPSNSGQVAGLEFAAGINPTLYVSSGNATFPTSAPTQGGIYTIPNSSTTATPITGTLPLGNSHIELAKNGKMYAIKSIFSLGLLSDTKLVGINTSNNSLDADVNLGTQPYTNGGYSPVLSAMTLPDQIDGEDYTYFFGQPKVTVTGITISGNSSGVFCFLLNNVFNCGPIPFNATYSGGQPTEYRFIIQALDNQCNPITGSIYMNYQGSFTAGSPPANLDLRTLTDANGFNIGNKTGRHVVTYSIKDACGNISSITRRINVSAGPAPDGVLTFNAGNSNAYSVYQSNPPSATTNLGGQYSSSVSINNSTGLINSYQITIQEVNCTNGQVIATIPTLGTQAVSNIANVPPVGLNFVSSGWFANQTLTSLQAKCFKLVLTVSNTCSSAAEWTYFKINGSYLTDPNDGSELTEANIQDRADDEGKPKIALETSVVPNPFQDKTTILVNDPDFKGIVEIMDLNGRTITALKPFNNDGEHTIYEFDSASITPGIYLYRIIQNSKVYSGKIVKL